ncbi:hypothetical protein EHS14_05770 [Schaalia georgiae]|nr:hypothetical protein EHS14_05770 [Schaalia georgiae]
MSENESPDAEASQHPRPDDWAVDRGRDHALTGEEIELPGAEYGDAADIVGLSSVPVVTGEIEAVSVGARRSSNPNVGPLQPKIEDRISTGEIPVAPVPSASEIPVVPPPGAGADGEPDAGPRESGASGRDPSAASASEAGAASEPARERKKAPEDAAKGAGAEGKSGDSSSLGEPAPSDGPSKEPGSAHSPGPGAPDASPGGADEGPAPAPVPEAPSGSAPAPKAEPAPSPEPDADALDAADAAFPPPSPADTRSTEDTIISDHPLVPRSAAEAGKKRGSEKARGAGKGTGAAEAPGAGKGAGGAEPEDAPPAPAAGGSDHDGTGNAPKGAPDSSAPATEPPAAPREADEAPAPATQPPAPDPSADGEPPEPPRSAAQSPAAPRGADEAPAPAPTTEHSAGVDGAPAPAAQPPAAPEGADEAPSPHGRARHGIPLPEEHTGAPRPKRRSWLFSSRAAQEPPASAEAEHAGKRVGERAEEPPAPPLPEQPEVPEPPVGAGSAEPPRADSDGAPGAPEPERGGERAEEPPAPPLPEGPKPAEKPEDEHREEPPLAAEDAPSAAPSPWSVLPPGAPRRSRRRGASEAPAKGDEESSTAAAPDAEAESPRAPGGAGRNKPPTPPATRMSRRARLGWDRPAPAPADEEPLEAASAEPSEPRPESASALRSPAAPAEEPPSTARRPPLETRKSRRARLGWDQPAPAPRPAPGPADEEPAAREEKSAYPTAAYSDEIRYPTAYSAGAAYPDARSDEDSARADDATGTAGDTDFRDGAGADDSRSAHSPWPSSPLPVAGSPGGQSSSWNDEMTRTYWHSPEEGDSEPVRAEPGIDETGVIAPTRRSLLSSAEGADEEEPPAPTPEKAEEAEFEESPRAASLDDAIFEGTTVKAELPNRSRAHWVGLVAFAIGVPLAWFLAADAGARMTLADNAPMVTGTASFLALGELLGALAFSVLLIAFARQSSLGAWAVGGLFTLIGLPWVLVPGPTATAMFPVMSALQSSGAVGANLQHHLQASGYSGRLLLIGVVLIGLGYVSHTTRRIGRAEEARRAEVERVNPSGAHFTSRERRRAHRAEGKR